MTVSIDPSRWNFSAFLSHLSQKNHFVHSNHHHNIHLSIHTHHIHSYISTMSHSFSCNGPQQTTLFSSSGTTSFPLAASPSGLLPSSAYDTSRRLSTEERANHLIHVIDSVLDLVDVNDFVDDSSPPEEVEKRQ